MPIWPRSDAERNVLLKSIGNDPDISEDYDYLLAMANAYQQPMKIRRLWGCLPARIRSCKATITPRIELRLAGEAGRQITDKVTAEPEFCCIPFTRTSTSTSSMRTFVVWHTILRCCRRRAFR